MVVGGQVTAQLAQLTSETLDDEVDACGERFDVRRLDQKTNKLERVTDAERREFGRRCSPLYCAKDRKDAAPTFIIHGSLDKLVPVHQSTMLHDLMTESGAVCRLDVEKIDHDPFAAVAFLPRLVKWFDKHLLDAK